MAELLAYTLLLIHNLTNHVNDLYNRAISYIRSEIAAEHAFAIQVGINSMQYTDRAIAATIKLVNSLISQTRAYALKQALLALATAKAYTDATISKLNKTVSSAYDATRADQATGITKILDVIATNSPEIKAVVGDLAKAVIGLIEIDDPVLRIAATFALKQVIDHLGVDTAIGKFTNDLVSGFIGHAAPQTIAAVETDEGNRLNALETQWQQFFANGGQDVEQLGDNLETMRSPVFLAVFLGLLGAEIVEPVATARVVADVIGEPLNALGVEFADLLSVTHIA
ncbi:MAG: hypothetical protein ACRD45_01285 [Bryobacteraceae bacterium]